MFTADDLDRLEGDEDGILELFNSNVVMISYGGGPRNSAQVYAMGVRAGWGQWTGRDKDGNALDVVTVANMSNQNPSFNAYWCPYESNDVQQVTLGNQADYMFTAKMDGCTFGVGSANPDGSRTVCHANVGGKGHDQLDLIKASASFQNDGGLSYLGPAAYRFQTGTEMYTQATTFGIRVPVEGRGNQWKFYSQVCMFNMDLKRIELFKVLPIG